VFLIEKGPPFSHSEDASWICDIAFWPSNLLCGCVSDIYIKLQGKCQLVTEWYNNVSTFQIKLMLFHSQLLNNNNADFPNCQKIFQQYKTNSGQYVRCIEQLQQSFTDRFVDFDQDRYCSEHLLTLLNHPMKMLNLLYSLN
jgi:hypothetical protein